jgi:hypothetical protein
MTMTSKKRKALTAAGWRVGDAADFLGLADEACEPLSRPTPRDWLSPV